MKRGYNEPPRGRMHEDDIMTLVEVQCGGAKNAADLAYQFGVSCGTIYKYSPAVVSYVTPWEKEEIVDYAEACGLTPSSYLAMLHQEYGLKLIEDIQKQGAVASIKEKA